MRWVKATRKPCLIIEPHGTKAVLFYPLEKGNAATNQGVHLHYLSLRVDETAGIATCDFSGVVYPQPIASPYVGKDGEGNLPDEQAIKRDAGRDFTGLERYAPGDNLN